MEKFKRVKAARVKEPFLSGNRIPDYHSMADSTREMIPVKMKKAVGTFFHILEDKNGDVYLLEDDKVRTLKLHELDLGESETKYLLTNREITDKLNEEKVGAAEGKRQIEEEEISEQMGEPLEEVKEEPTKAKKKRKPKATKKKKVDNKEQ